LFFPAVFCPAVYRTAPDGAEQIETFDYVLISSDRMRNVQGSVWRATSVKLGAQGRTLVRTPMTARALNGEGSGAKGRPTF
jgi:hypothetical protein